MSSQSQYNLSAKSREIIKNNIKEANNILQSINTEKCVKENHQCDKVKQYLKSL